LCKHVRRVDIIEISANKDKMINNDGRIIVWGRTLDRNIKLDSKIFYRYLRHKGVNTVSVGSIEMECGNLIVENMELADEVERCVTSVFTTYDESNIPEIFTYQEMEEGEVDTREIYNQQGSGI